MLCFGNSKTIRFNNAKKYVNLSKNANCINKRIKSKYERLLNKFTKDPEKFNHHPTQHHDSVLLHFSQEKQILLASAIKIIKFEI